MNAKTDLLQGTLLPAPTVQCHAANLVVLPDDRIGCAWFGGTQEGMADISVWFSIRDASGEWSDPVRVSDDATRSEQNPVPFVIAADEWWILYTAQQAGNQDTAEIRHAVSHDSGSTWQPGHIRILGTDGGGIFVRQPPVTIDDGRLLLPAFRCPTPANGRWVGDEDDSIVLASADGGTTWTHHPVPGSTGSVHMNILPARDGSFVALFRRRQADAIHRSHSSDGLTWSEPVPTALPNNNSSIQATLLDDGRFVVAYNHSSRADAVERRSSLYDEIDGSGAAGDQQSGLAFWGVPRAPMALAVSADEGLTWSDPLEVEGGDGYCLSNDSRTGRNRELSYPSVTQAPDGSLHLAYTRFRKAIKHVLITPDQLDA